MIKKLIFLCLMMAFAITAQAIDITKNGEFKTYYPDGSIHSLGTFKEGLRDGVFRLYHANGNLMEESVYWRGKRVSYKSFNEDGTLRSTELPIIKGKSKLIPEKEIKGKLRICPEHWYEDYMPPDPPRQYFVVDGKRREVAEIDVEWIKQNCETKIEKVY